jgi:hypothetical protein
MGGESGLPRVSQLHDRFINHRRNPRDSLFPWVKKTCGSSPLRLKPFPGPCSNRPIDFSNKISIPPKNGVSVYQQNWREDEIGHFWHISTPAKHSGTGWWSPKTGEAVRTVAASGLSSIDLWKNGTFSPHPQYISINTYIYIYMWFVYTYMWTYLFFLEMPNLPSQITKPMGSLILMLDFNYLVVFRKRVSRFPFHRIFKTSWFIIKLICSISKPIKFNFKSRHWMSKLSPNMYFR